MVVRQPATCGDGPGSSPLDPALVCATALPRKAMSAASATAAPKKRHKPGRVRFMTPATFSGEYGAIMLWKALFRAAGGNLSVAPGTRRFGDESLGQYAERRRARRASRGRRADPR